MDTVGMSNPCPQQFHSTEPHVLMSGISWIPSSTSIIEVMDENLCSLKALAVLHGEGAL